MNPISVSYNFPDDFLWGISAKKSSLFENKDFSYLYTAKENNIKALSITLKWADFEPLKQNYNEELIESTRNLLSRIHSLNIKSIIIADIGEIPGWQNIEKKDSFSNERFDFTAYLSKLLAPYMDYIGLCCSENAFFSKKMLKSEMDLHRKICEYVHSLSEQIKIGTFIPPGIYQSRKPLFSKILHKPQLDVIKDMEMDFLGIPAEKTVRDEIHTIYGKDKIPLFVYDDNLQTVPPGLRMDTLLDQMYDFWHMYQKGWPIIGYLSDIEIDSETPEKMLFNACCRKNAVEISTETSYLSEKWIHFLKD